MIKRRYKLPIKGTVLVLEPLTGANDDPICVIPLDGIAGYLTGEFRGYICLNYNIVEEWCEVELEASKEFHDWLQSILPQLNDIKGKKKWRLNKSLMLG